MTIECSQSVHSIVSTLHQNARCEPDGCRIVEQKSQRDFPKSNICVILSKVIRLLQFAGGESCEAGFYFYDRNLGSLESERKDQIDGTKYNL